MQRVRWFQSLSSWRIALVAIAGTLLNTSGCALLAEGNPYASLPPCVDSYCSCGDFANQALAQQVLDSFADDLYGLDRDRNGLACESLPQRDLSLDPPTYFSNSEHLTFGNPSNAGRRTLTIF